MAGISTGVSTDSDGMITGVSVRIDHEKISHINALLQSVPGKALLVYRRAVRRALSAGRAQANKEIRERYDISNANLNNDAGHTYKTYSEKISETENEIVGYINFAGEKIPLYRFHPQPKTRTYTTRYVNGRGGWRVTTAVSAADVRGSMRPLPAGFIATFPSGHTGIFSRTSGQTASGKDKIREYWGFDVQHMLDYQPAREAVQKRMKEILDKRLDHELMLALDQIK